MSIEHARNYLPAAGRDLFLPLYDPLTTVIGMGRVRTALIEQATLAPGHCVLDLGCGTGSLLIELKRTHPSVVTLGIDPDPLALRRARRKAGRAKLDIRFERGFGDALDCADESFDRVLSSFMFHHLSLDQRLQTLLEIQRVLKPGARLEMVDFAGREAVRTWGLHRLLHSDARLAGNDRSEVIALMARAGLAQPTVLNQRRTLFGTLVFYQALRGAR